jgi:hypothetical protein
MLLPEPDSTDPQIVLEHSILLRVRNNSTAEWMAAERARGHICQCGCGQPIELKAQHRSKGIPSYRHGHHHVPMTMAGEVSRLRREGYLTVAEAAAALGIGTNTLRRLDGRAYDSVRFGGRNIRAFTQEMVRQVETWLTNGRKRRVAAAPTNVLSKTSKAMP